MDGGRPRRCVYTHQRSVTARLAPAGGSVRHRYEWLLRR
jgi:hypothetical protein